MLALRLKQSDSGVPEMRTSPGASSSAFCTCSGVASRQARGHLGALVRPAAERQEAGEHQRKPSSHPGDGMGARDSGALTYCCCGHQEAFGEKTAARDLRRYRRRGPRKTTRQLLEALRSQGVEDATVLDIGGGVGVIEHELLESGAMRAEGVDASRAYLRAAREEAERRGHSDRLVQRPGRLRGRRRLR